MKRILNLIHFLYKAIFDLSSYRCKDGAQVKDAQLRIAKILLNLYY